MFQWIRSLFTRATTATPYYGASVVPYETSGLFGGKAQPWSYEAGVRAFTAWAYAAAMLNANAAASVPLRLYTRASPEREKLFATRRLSRSEAKALSMVSPAIARKVIAYGYDVEEVTEPHPILTTLETTNKNQNGYELKVLLTVDLQITGNAYLHPITTPDGVPFEVHRMPSQWVNVKVNNTELVEAYIYGKIGSVKREFPASDVIHFRLPNPADLVYGKGWVEAAWNSLGLAGSKREMDAAFFENMARPDWLFSVPGLKKEDYETLRERIKELHGGSRSSGKVMVVNADAKATALQWQVNEFGTPTRVIEEIAAVSGVPVAMLLSNDPNRANSESARIGWYRNTVRPYCTLLAEKLNEQWVPRFDAGDAFLCHDLTSFEDEERQAKRIIGYVAGGVLTANEARMEIGYPPHDGDDADVLNAPAGTSGGAAAIAGDLSPGQNQDREGGREDGDVKIIAGIAELAKSMRPEKASAPTINVHPPAVTINNQPPAVTLNHQAAPVTVNVPETKVDVAPAPAPVVNVNVPQQPAPVVNVMQPAAISASVAAMPGRDCRTQ